MFVVELSVGLATGALPSAFLLARLNFRVSVVAFGVAAICIALLSFPFDLGARISSTLGVAMGFLLAATVVDRGPQRGRPVDDSAQAPPDAQASEGEGSVADRAGP